MQNNNIFQNSLRVIMLAFTLAFFAHTTFAYADVNSGTIRICSVLASTTTTAFASADASVPEGHLSLSIATTTDFSSPLLTHVFDAQAFAHNTTIDGVPMHCTDAVTVPFGQYYYNNPSVVGSGVSTWSASKYFDLTTSFSFANASAYSNGLFTPDPADDAFVNIAADGSVNVNQVNPNRTVIVLNTFSNVLNTVEGGLSTVSDTDALPAQPGQCIANTNMISNGGFESPKLTIPWGSVHLNTPGFFWTSYDTVVYPFVEVQAGYTEGTVQWLPHTGTQYAEIDGGTNHDVSQVLATIPGNTYTISYWATPRPTLATTTNVMNISVNGQLIDTFIGQGSVMTDWSNRSYSFTATSTISRISFTQGQNVHKGEGVFLDDVSVVCNPSAPAVNHAPTITLTGSNPLILTVGQTFTDPGATATDLEDGNITNKIVVTGAVNTSGVSTSTITYSVTDTGGLTATTTRLVLAQNLVVVPAVHACTIVSDTTTFAGNIPAVATYNQHPAWTASIPGATWIWSTYKVTDPLATTTVVFSKTFVATSTLPHAILSIASDNSYVVKVNGVIAAQNLGEFNFNSVATHDIASSIVAGINTITFEVTNFPLAGASPEVNPAGLLYKLDLTAGCTPVVPANNPPVITLIGLNPSTLTTGQAWNDPGATATDLEDGNITNKIVVTGAVGTTTPGTYVLTYTVTDTGGLSASTTRQVIVSNGSVGVTTGKVTFCSIFANKDTNGIATSSTELPTGSFTIKLATSTDIANSTLQTKIWNANTFAPNAKVILSQNDADCISYDNLPLGTYYYSELGVTGSQWVVSSTSPKYNDQFNAPVNNIFDVFSYSPELFNATSTDDASRNVNADGQIVVSADRREHVVVIVTKYDPTKPPVEPPCLGCGGGTVTPPACTSNCGGGGGGNGPIVSSLAVTNEKVVEITPGVALVTWNTNLPATKEVGYGNTSQPASFVTAPFGYATSTVRVAQPLETIHSYTIAIESGKTYYFRPVSTDFKTTVAGIELVLNPGTTTGGNGGGSSTGGSNACYYLFDYLKQGWNNNPIEVKKLQVFLRDLEGYSVAITGVYDDQTVSALNAFQMRYKDDVLTPWGHTAPTSFTYITTKKKVNEIYCKTAFPVNEQQQKEIDAYRAFLEGLRSAGVVLGAPSEEQIKQPVIIDTNEVGTLPQVSSSTLATLAGGSVQSTTTTAGRLTANVIASGKKIGNFMVALFTWPWDWVKALFGGNDDVQCSNQSVFSNWFNWILVIIILTMTYLWYRERKINKKIAELNEEIDLMK